MRQYATEPGFCIWNRTAPKRRHKARQVLFTIVLMSGGHKTELITPDGKFEHMHMIIFDMQFPQLLTQILIITIF